MGDSQVVAESRPPPARQSKVDARLENLRKRFAALAREAGVLGPDDEVEATVQLTKFSPAMILLILVGIVPGILLLLLFQRFCLVLVTGHEVIVTGWALGTKKSLRKVLRLARPQRLTLSEPPKRSHFFGNKVQLPAEIATFLGRDIAYAQFGMMADEAFEVARTAPAG